MIIEQYVSFETAKLLMKKGFLQVSQTCYDKDGNVKLSLGNYGHYQYVRPTQQMAMRWLREVHNLSIAPYRTACGYLYTIDRIPTGSTIFSAQYEGDDEDSGQFTTWELAVENAIKYCLENLI